MLDLHDSRCLTVERLLEVRMHVDLQCAESFVVLGEELHYGRAAARLYVTSPALSRRIQRLERQLSATLLVRGPAGVLKLTLAGVQVLRDFEILLVQEADLREAALHPRTTLVLGVPDDGRDGRAFASQALALQRLMHDDDPGARVAVRRVPLPLMNTWLLDGRVDVQLTSGAVRSPLVRSTPLVNVPRILAVHVNSPYADADHLQLSEVVELPLLYDPDLSNAFMAPFWLGDLRPRSQAHLVSIVARDSSAVYEHVARGHGATILLAAQRDEVPAKVRVLPLPDVPPLMLHAITRADDRRSLVRSLVGSLLVVMADSSTGIMLLGRSVG